MIEEARQFGDQRARLPRHQPLQVAPERLQEFGLADDVRQRDHDQDQQRHHRQQRVVRHRAGEQQTLVRPEGLQYPQGERAGMAQYLQGG